MNTGLSISLGVGAYGLAIWGALTSPQVARVRALRRSPDRPKIVYKRTPDRIIGKHVNRLLHLIPVLKHHSFADESIEFMGRAVCVLVSVGYFFPKLLWLAIVWLAFQPWLTHRRRQRERIRDIERELPMAIDLYGVCVSSGLNVTMATRAVAHRSIGPLADELKTALSQVDRGQRMADALDEVVARTCESVRPLVAGLAACERYGSSLSATLERLAHESRLSQEWQAERAAKQLSIKLLFPVAGLILPAFALLTVAPLIASSYGSLASSLF